MPPEDDVSSDERERDKSVRQRLEGLVPDLVKRTFYAGLGAVFMIAADVLSRIIIPGQVLPIGVITALFGAPAFALILSQRRSAL